jgi:hypothetical protein
MDFLQKDNNKWMYRFSTIFPKFKIAFTDFFLLGLATGHAFKTPFVTSLVGCSTHCPSSESEFRWSVSYFIIIHVTDVTLQCAISHQVTKSIKKLEERRSTLLFYHSKLQHVKTRASWQTPLKNLSMCCLVYNKDY